MTGSTAEFPGLFSIRVLQWHKNLQGLKAYFHVDSPPSCRIPNRCRLPSNPGAHFLRDYLRRQHGGGDFLPNEKRICSLAIPPTIDESLSQAYEKTHNN